MEDRQPLRPKSTGPVHMNYGNESRPEGPGGLVSNASPSSQRPVYPDGMQAQIGMAEQSGDGDCERHAGRESALDMLDRKIVELEAKQRGLKALRKNLGENPSPELEETVWRILQGEFRRM